MHVDYPAAGSIPVAWATRITVVFQTLFAHAHMKLSRIQDAQSCATSTMPITHTVMYILSTTFGALSGPGGLLCSAAELKRLQLLLDSFATTEHQDRVYLQVCMHRHFLN